MLKKTLACAFMSLTFSSATMAQTDTGQASSQPAKAEPQTINCRTMEVFVAKSRGASVLIFHQRDKADGPKLSELLEKYAGQEVEVETGDGKRHRATVERIKSCFGRGMLIFSADEANLRVKEDFILHFGGHL